jgi:hypothetical protein
MKKAKVIINEQHTLMAEQRQILDTKYDKWEFVKVPAEGWTLNEQKEQSQKLQSDSVDIIFASPVPYLLCSCTYLFGFSMGMEYCPSPASEVLIFHNDIREKKEIPGGRIINVVSQTGWVLVSSTL